jgi:hypothetical protein
MLSRKEVGVAVVAATPDGSSVFFIRAVWKPCRRIKASGQRDGYIGSEVTTRFPISHQTTMSSGCVSARLYSMRGDPSRTSLVSK